MAANLRNLPCLVLGACLLLQATAASAALLYQDTFEPGDLVDYTAVTGAITFGLPDIAGPQGAMPSNSARFSTVGNQPNFFYDQAEYAIPATVTAINLSFDVLFTNFVGAPNLLFTLFLDAPTINYLQFRSNGTLFATGFGSRTFSNDTLMHVTVQFDEVTRRWSSAINGTPFSNSLASDQPPDLRDVRFALGFQTGSNQANPLAAVYVDNVAISTVPLPGALGLFTSALAGLVAGAAGRDLRRRDGLRPA